MNKVLKIAEYSLVYALLVWGMCAIYQQDQTRMLADAPEYVSPE